MSQFNLIKLQHFFEVDKKIKKEMISCAPPMDNGYLDDNSLCKYTNDLEESLIYIFSELKCIALDIFGEDSIVLEKIEKMEKMNKNAFYSCGLDISKLRNYYRNNISNMEMSFINEVKKKCVGYLSFDNLPVESANSINEILHLIHSHLLNNEEILHSIPEISHKINDFSNSITLRGNSSIVSSQIFDKFPNDLEVGITDIVALNEKKLLIMVRDRAHALTTEVSINNNIARVEYFVPKIGETDLINVLPGINKVNSADIGTTGIFETDVNSLSESLFDFISKVPTDYMCYEHRMGK